MSNNRFILSFAELHVRTKSFLLEKLLTIDTDSHLNNKTNLGFNTFKHTFPVSVEIVAGGTAMDSGPTGTLTDTLAMELQD